MSKMRYVFIEKSLRIVDEQLLLVNAVRHREPFLLPDFGVGESFTHQVLGNHR